MLSDVWVGVFKLVLIRLCDGFGFLLSALATDSRLLFLSEFFFSVTTITHEQLHLAR